MIKLKSFILKGGSVCFSKGGKYFKQEGKFDTQGNVGFDNNKVASNNVCCNLP